MSRQRHYFVSSFVHSVLSIETALFTPVFEHHTTVCLKILTVIGQVKGVLFVARQCPVERLQQALGHQSSSRVYYTTSCTY
jgi:hypothetical protein